MFCGVPAFQAGNLFFGGVARVALITEQEGTAPRSPALGFEYALRKFQVLLSGTVKDIHPSLSGEPACREPVPDPVAEDPGDRENAGQRDHHADVGEHDAVELKEALAHTRRLREIRDLDRRLVIGVHGNSLHEADDHERDDEQVVLEVLDLGLP